MLFFTLSSVGPNLYEQRDPDNPKLRRESDELFLKDPIPALNLQLVRIHCISYIDLISLSKFCENICVKNMFKNLFRFKL